MTGKWFRSVVLAVAAAAVAAGCSGPAYNVGVSLSPDLKTVYSYVPSIEVDLAGITPSELERVSGYSVDSWFDAGNPMRASLVRKTMRFSEDAPLKQLLSKKDPIWEAWDKRGADVMAVFVNLPAEGAAAGKSDPRRHMVPLRSGHWYKKDGGSLWIQVGAGGIVELAGEPPEPEFASPAPATEKKKEP